MDGYFRYFDSPDDIVAKKTVLLPKDVIAIKTGHDVDSSSPPEGYKRDALLQLILRDEIWVLCAENVDDML